jgi:hypothetical protein
LAVGFPPRAWASNFYRFLALLTSRTGLGNPFLSIFRFSRFLVIFQVPKPPKRGGPKMGVQRNDGIQSKNDQKMVKNRDLCHKMGLYHQKWPHISKKGPIIVIYGINRGIRSPIRGVPPQGVGYPPPQGRGPRYPWYSGGVPPRGDRRPSQQ